MNDTELNTNDINMLTKKLSSIPVPEGDSDDCYLLIITPEEELLQIETSRETEPERAELRQQLYNYRYRQAKDGNQVYLTDRFLAFWVTLQYYDVSTKFSKRRQRLAYRELEDFLYNKSLLSVIPDINNYPRMLYEALYCSVRRYIATCREDKTFTSVVFGLGTLKDDQVKGKILYDLINGLCFCYKIGLITAYPVLAKAIIHALIREFPFNELTITERIISLLDFQTTQELIDSIR